MISVTFPIDLSLASSEAVYKEFKIHALYTDISKAFDTVCFGILIHKLRNFGIHGELLNRSLLYLTLRLQKLVVCEYEVI